jgi:hypothetical protein
MIFMGSMSRLMVILEKALLGQVTGQGRSEGLTGPLLETL